MRDIDKINELLHFMKGSEPFSKTLAELIETREEWCPFLHDEGVNLHCYNANPSVTALLYWIDKYVICCKYLDANKYTVDAMADVLTRLRIPERMTEYDDFDSLIQELEIHIHFVEPDVTEKLNRFTCQECQRLDEALVCFQNYCFYSSIVMAVSAVECRIVEMIRRSNEELYLCHFGKSTLGQLIQVFDESQYKGDEFRDIKKLMPAKHRPLISLLNQYRVFSAHPTDEVITCQIAEAILHLSFRFVMDSETCPYEPDELTCEV